jgi:cytochrome bd-type quinol oxidase subunit 2
VPESAAGREPVARDSHSLRSGPGLIIVVVYGVLALAATGRSVLQIVEYFERAPLSYLLSAFAAVVYILATIALASGLRRLAWVTISIEMVGVLVVGAASYLVPESFPDKTVWSHFGSGYGFVPLVLPALGLWWLYRSRRAPHTD